MNIHTHIEYTGYMLIHMYVLYIYIYREREVDRERERDAYV